MNVFAIDDPAWRDFVESRSDATIFHHPEWARLVADCYGYRPLVVAESLGGAIASGTPAIAVRRPLGPRRWVSLPFTDHCPPLDGAAGVDLLGGLHELARGSAFDVFELRASAASGEGAPFVRHTVPLTPDTRALWKRLRRNHRRSVEDANESGARVVRGTDASDLETFYRIHMQTRRRLGVPVQPLRFFRLFYERIVRAGLGFVLTAYVGDVAAASAVFCAWNGTVVCKYSGRADGFERLDAIHLLFWNGIRWGAENGFHTFDLGRTNVEQARLRSFKDGWGTREEPLAYSYIERVPKARRAAASSHRAERAMAQLIQRSSPWVCRAIGEVLYKYAA
jgi:CelD/BcsL family acetyltransferase involved in cellulose biosynthesis